MWSKQSNKKKVFARIKKKGEGGYTLHTYLLTEKAKRVVGMVKKQKHMFTVVKQKFILMVKTLRASGWSRNTDPGR